MNRFLRTQRGFTLVEVLLYLAISSMVALVMFQALQLFDAARARHAGIAAIDGEASFVAQRLHDILRANTAVSPAGQENNSALEVSDGTTVSLADTTVMVQRGASPAQPLTSEHVVVAGLLFENLAASGSPDIIQVHFTIRSSPSYSHDYTLTIGTR